MTAAIANKDEKLKKVLHAVAVVPSAVKDSVLEHWIIKCQQLHAIAFWQWRLKHPNTVRFNQEEVEALILRRINYFYESLNDQQFVSPDTNKQA
jgi:hypothetical protein